ncbi:DUF2188 domain-containing protein [Streptococcus agalactiae]
MAKNQHVVPNPNGGWDIKGAGNSHISFFQFILYLLKML